MAEQKRASAEFTAQEITDLSDALLTQIEEVNRAREMVPDDESRRAMERYAVRLRRLLNRLSAMEIETWQ